MSQSSPTSSASSLIVRGATLSYLGVMVLLPIVALAIQAVLPGPRRFWEVLSDPFAWHSLKLTFVTAAAMVVVNVIMGTATAWVLVRHDFPGKSLVNALIDLPFAIPTIVAGLMIAIMFGPSTTIGVLLGKWGWAVLYHKPGIILALMFVTYPLVVRTVQPVLLEIEPAEEEAAATLGASSWTTFWRVTLPTLWPSILTGAALSFSRALGEFGSVVMVAGNQPMKTKTAPLYIYGEIESSNPEAAMVVSVVLLAASLGVLVALNLLQRGKGRTHV